MEPLRNGRPGPGETWEELAEHALTHDDVGSPILLAAARGPLRVEHDRGVTRLLDCDGWPLPRYRQRGEAGW